MSAVDVKCPICEKLNKSLNLEETDGWSVKTAATQYRY